MALFKTSKRKQNRAKEPPAFRALDLLIGLGGVWSGVRQDFDPDDRILAAAPTGESRDFCVEYELNPEGTHVIVHNEVSAGGRIDQTFDVWGLGAGADELIRTAFSSGTRQSSAFEIKSLDTERTGRTWHMILETVSWDDGRPCEFRYELSRGSNRLEIRVSRCLINEGPVYEVLSQARLTKVR